MEESLKILSQKFETLFTNNPSYTDRPKNGYYFYIVMIIHSSIFHLNKISMKKYKNKNEIHDIESREKNGKRKGMKNIMNCPLEMINLNCP
jgi:hypothetical protein